MSEIPEEELRELLVRWKNAAEYARSEALMREYDGIMGCVDELEALIDNHE